MEMDVEDGLPSAAIGVEERAVAGLRESAFFGDRCGASYELADDLLILDADVVQRRDVPLRNDQHVRWRLRVDVVECQYSIVFIDDARGNRAIDDFAEQAIGH